ncbi:hypothetical protein ACS8E3_05915 [Psychrobacter sp. 2Y5]|uniref:hypothetical protein n=1 Tax=unclassified Psychrobacter TaxID=196806 RepID=UPI003F45F287
MATIEQTHTPILNGNAQVLILPVNSAGILLDPILTRCKTLYPDNYQRYHRACRDGSLMVGSCLLHKRQRELAGLSASHNSNQPSYIVNLVISNHPYHPARTRWLTSALIDLQQQLRPLIRYQGVRKAALLARPFFSHNSANMNENNSASLSTEKTLIPLDWHSVVLPLITQHLEPLPKLRIAVHVPKSVAL